MTDGNELYCGDHFTRSTYIESVCHTPETNIMSYVHYTLIKKKTPKLVLFGKGEKRTDSKRNKEIFFKKPHSFFKGL